MTPEEVAKVVDENCPPIVRMAYYCASGTALSGNPEAENELAALLRAFTLRHKKILESQLPQSRRN